VAAVTTEERKVVTVLFADLADSTQLAGTLDPERFREVMAAFYRSASEELESLRGRAEKFVGDAVMAVWGLPHAHIDDALRAVRAGFVIRDRISRLGGAMSLPVPLRVRIGINSGPVAAGSGPAGQFLVSGVPVNLASRLQSAAEPGEILVGETTYQLTQHSVEYGPARTVEARGFAAPVTAWQALSLSAKTTRRTIPLVGRRGEMHLLSDTFARMRSSGRAHMVTVLGEPGIGKSRLVDEFVSGLPDEAKVLVGGVSAFDEDDTFAPLADMIRRDLGVERETPTKVVRQRLDELVEGCCDANEAEQIAARLGLALGLGIDVREDDPQRMWDESLARFEEYLEDEERDGREGREGHRYRAAEIRAGFERLLEGLARHGPVVVIFEDLQTARSDLLDLLEQVVRRSRRLPLLMVCVARDELLDERPGWAGGIPDALTLRLEPLEGEDAEELARVAGESLDEATARRIARQAGGNPFFIVETTGMLMQRHEAHIEGASHEHLLPPTVQAVVASRIDHLPDPARELLRTASVFARSTFSEDDLSLVAEPDQALLQTLEEEEFLVRDPDRPRVWRYRHEMLRDVAYESLPKRERLRLHVQAAEGLQKADGERPQVVAYHLEQAAMASLDLEPQDRTLPDRAVKALSKAGDQARWRMESRTAVDLYRRALTLAGVEEGWGRREARILSGTGEAWYWLGEFEQAREALTDALRRAGEDPWTRTHASRFLADVVLNVDEDPDRAGVLFDEALKAADELGDPYGKARTLLMAGWVPYWRGDIETARHRFEEALQIARENPEGDRWAEARALVALTSVISPVGDEEEALALARQALDIGRQMNDLFTTGVAQEYVGNSLRRMLRVPESRESLDEAVTTFRDLGARWELASALGDRGDLRWLAGELREAQADLEEALALCRRLGERSLIRWTSSRLVQVLLGQDKTDAARRLMGDPTAWGGTDPTLNASRAFAEGLMALHDGDREVALERFLRVLDIEREENSPNAVAAVVWWIGRVIGAEAVGGEEALEEARGRLEAAHWAKAIEEPELVMARLA
jgi:class 3 adenylate cyclase/tetratricopeptide (TPR) repeat protein